MNIRALACVALAAELAACSIDDRRTRVAPRNRSAGGTGATVDAAVVVDAARRGDHDSDAADSDAPGPRCPNPTLRAAPGLELSGSVESGTVTITLPGRVAIDFTRRANWQPTTWFDLGAVRPVNLADFYYSKRFVEAVQPGGGNEPIACPTCPPWPSVAADPKLTIVDQAPARVRLETSYSLPYNFVACHIRIDYTINASARIGVHASAQCDDQATSVNFDRVGSLHVNPTLDWHPSADPDTSPPSAYWFQRFESGAFTSGVLAILANVPPSVVGPGRFDLGWRPQDARDIPEPVFELAFLPQGEVRLSERVQDVLTARGTGPEHESDLTVVSGAELVGGGYSSSVASYQVSARGSHVSLRLAPRIHYDPVIEVSNWNEGEWVAISGNQVVATARTPVSDQAVASYDESRRQLIVAMSGEVQGSEQQPTLVVAGASSNNCRNQGLVDAAREPDRDARFDLTVLPEGPGFVPKGTGGTYGESGGAGGQPDCAPGFPFDTKFVPFPSAVPASLQPPPGASYLGRTYVKAIDYYACWRSTSDASVPSYTWQSRGGQFDQCGLLTWKGGMVRFDLGNARSLVATAVAHASPSGDAGGGPPEREWWLLRVEPPLPQDLPDIGWIVQTGTGEDPPLHCDFESDSKTRTYDANFWFFTRTKNSVGGAPDASQQP